MAKAKQPPGPAMNLGNMGRLGVHHLIASCLNDACRHQGSSTYRSIRPIPRSLGFVTKSCAPSAAGVGTAHQVVTATAAVGGYTRGLRPRR